MKCFRHELSFYELHLQCLFLLNHQRSRDAGPSSVLFRSGISWLEKVFVPFILFSGRTYHEIMQEGRTYLICQNQKLEAYDPHMRGRHRIALFFHGQGKCRSLRQGSPTSGWDLSRLSILPLTSLLSDNPS